MVALPNPFEDLFADGVEALTVAPQAAPAMKPKFELVRVSDMEFREPEFHIDGILETSSFALIFGDPGCCKSFVAIGMACCVACGVPFHGREVRQGPVIYIAGEGHSGLTRRVKAWERQSGVATANAPLFFSKMAADFLDANFVSLVAEVVDSVAAAEGPPALIIIDTLARNFGSGNESAPPDMNAFVNAVCAVTARYDKCTGLVVHHTGHAEKMRARGSMNLKAALDVEYRVEKDGDEVRVVNTKTKDAAVPPDMHFVLTPVDVGVTKECEVITSAVLVERMASGQPKKAPRLMGDARIGFDTFNKVRRETCGAMEDLSASVHVDDWRRAFYAAHTGDNQDAKKVAFQRARKKLVESGWLSVHDDHYRLARLET
ncbi:AAA family ATPase [Rhodobacter sp. CZR27]|uniref:AAA family ATPase n=1 Tax=Rhodobacter sp. CZR27 TaxID=2033869 RepID=UPI000BBEA4FD|nr:AAA family ATPase [Rhodobacter sp. CZR27]